MLGHFKLVINSHEVGDWDDTATLDSIFGWIEDFLDKPVERIEQKSELLSKEQVFASFYDPYMLYKVTQMEPTIHPKGVVDRFNISYLGMSSFDDFAVLLIESKKDQRVLWSDLRSRSILETRLPPSTIQSIFAESLQRFHKEVRNS